MRIYYIFKINKSVSNLYRNQEYVLYDILTGIYKMNKSDLVLGYKFFEQFAHFFNKQSVNEYIYNNYKNNVTYIKNINRHIINDRFRNEFSSLIVYNSHIKLKTNLDISDFLKSINRYESNLFVCDFKNHDYFWLDNIVKSIV